MSTESSSCRQLSSWSDIHADSLEAIDMVLPKKRLTEKKRGIEEQTKMEDTSRRNDLVDKESRLTFEEIVVARVNRLLQFTLQLECRDFELLERVRVLEAEVENVKKESSGKKDSTQKEVTVSCELNTPRDKCPQSIADTIKNN